MMSLRRSFILFRYAVLVLLTIPARGQSNPSFKWNKLPVKALLLRPINKL